PAGGPDRRAGPDHADRPGGDRPGVPRLPGPGPVHRGACPEAAADDLAEGTRGRSARQRGSWGGVGLGAGRRAIRALAYTWAAPTSLVGLAAGALTLATGGRVQRRR